MLSVAEIRGVTIALGQLCGDSFVETSTLSVINGPSLLIWSIMYKMYFLKFFSMINFLVNSSTNIYH